MIIAIGIMTGCLAVAPSVSIEEWLRRRWLGRRPWWQWLRTMVLETDGVGV